MASCTRALKYWLLGLFTVLAGVGLAGCGGDSSNDHGAMYGPVIMYGPAPMYGVAIVATVHGTATDGVGHTVPGIQITAVDAGHTWNTITGSDGAYTLPMPEAANGDTVTVTATDVDGAANGGSFNPASATITVDLPTNYALEVDFPLTPKQ